MYLTIAFPFCLYLFLLWTRASLTLRLLLLLLFLFVFVLMRIPAQLKRNFKSNPEVTWDIYPEKENLIAILPTRKTFSIRNKKKSWYLSLSFVQLNGFEWRHVSIPLFIFSVEWFCVSRANWQKAHIVLGCVSSA